MLILKEKILRAKMYFDEQSLKTPVEIWYERERESLLKKHSERKFAYKYLTKKLKNSEYENQQRAIILLRSKLQSELKNAKIIEEFTRDTFFEYIKGLKKENIKINILKRKHKILPDMLSVNKSIFGLLYERGDKLHLFLRFHEKDYKYLLKATQTASKTFMTVGSDWYSFILDDKFYNNQKIKSFITNSYNYVLENDKLLSDKEKKDEYNNLFFSICDNLIF